MKRKLLYLLFFVSFSQMIFSQNLSLDTSFGVGGRVLGTYSNTQSGYLASIQQQSDGKIVGFGYLPFSWLGNHFLIRFNADGSIDTTFGINGKIFTPIVSESSGYNQLRIQSDDKILISGMQRIGQSTVVGFATMRYNSDGSLDTSFGQDGLVFTDINNNTDSSTVVEIQTDDKILVAGISLANGLGSSFGIVRYNIDGSLDSSFGVNGEIDYNIGSIVNNVPVDCYVSSLKIQNNGKIVLAGMSNFNYAVLRLNENGSIDTNFAVNGVRMIDFVTDQVGPSLVLTEDNKIVVVGASNDLSSNNLSRRALAKLDDSGNFDFSFGNNGKVIMSLEINSTFEAINDIELLGDGKILCLGTTISDSSYNSLIMRFNQNGILDSTFDSDGFYTADFGDNSRIYLASLIVQSNGKITCSGSNLLNNVQNYTLTRYELTNLSTSQFSKPQFSVSPNPFTTSINLTFSLSKNENLTIDLVDVNGRVIQNLSKEKSFSSGNNSLNLDLPETLSKGIYFLKINDGFENNTIKIIK